jgi:hypothetical protein
MFGADVSAFLFECVRMLNIFPWAIKQAQHETDDLPDTHVQPFCFTSPATLQVSALHIIAQLVGPTVEHHATVNSTVWLSHTDNLAE